MTTAFATPLRLAGRIDALNRRLACVVRWGLLANAVLIAGNAFSRKLFGVASFSKYDVQPHFFAAAVLLMAAYTLQRDEHVRIDVYSGWLGPRGMAWLDLAGIVLVLLPLCAAAIWVTAPEFANSHLQMLIVAILVVFPGIARPPPPAATMTEKQVEEALKPPAELATDPPTDSIPTK